MDIENLNLFIEVMRQGSFAEVARSRGVAPSSISRSIAGLENELGVRLFHRSTRKLEPTEAGLIYFERVEPVVDALESARHFAMDMSETPRGTLRVTAPNTFAQTAIVPRLPELAALYPQLKVELILTDAYLDLVEERIDVAIRLGSLKSSSYIARRLQAMAFHVCASPEYLRRHGEPNTPDEITEHHCLLFPRTGYNLDWVFRDRQGTQRRIPIQGRYLITSSEAIKQCTLAGMGLSLLPGWLVDTEINNGKLVKLLPDYDVTATDYESAVWLLYPSRDYLPLKSRAFIDFLAARMGEAG